MRREERAETADAPTKSASRSARGGSRAKRAGREENQAKAAPRAPRGQGNERQATRTVTRIAQPGPKEKAVAALRTAAAKSAARAATVLSGQAQATPTPARPGSKPMNPDLVARVWSRYRLQEGAKPFVGALTIGTVATALAVELGVAEVLFGAFVGYAGYRMLRYGVSLRKALRESADLEKILASAGAV